jgi:transposase
MGNARGVRRDFKALERRRFEALKLLRQGYNQSEVSRRVKVCSQTVSRWARAVSAEGDVALEATGRAGRKPQLDEKQRAQLSRGCWKVRETRLSDSTVDLQPGSRPD